MTPAAIALILISAFGHAFWNFLGKRRDPTPAFFFVANLAPAVCLSPIIWLVRENLFFIPASIWILILATGVFQAVYFLGLAGAYQQGDLSLAYPLARALPVLMIASVSILLGRGDQIEWSGLIGMGLVGLGCFILPATRFRTIRFQNYWNLCCALAVLAAIGTTGYTLIDDTALRQLRELGWAGWGNGRITVLFAALEACSIMLMLGLYILLSKKNRLELKQIFQAGENLAYASIAGIVMLVTYGLVLAAMAYARDVSYVAAFRQVSIPLGATLGITIQKEPAYRPKMTGIGVIVFGLLLLTL